MQASDYTAMFAAIIALASLYVAVQQTRLTRKHNQLSVRPLLALYRKEFKNLPIEYSVINHGLGPAVVVEYEVFVDDKKIEAPDGNIVLAALDRMSISRENVQGHLLASKEVLMTGHEITLLKFSESANDEDTFKDLLGKLPRLKFKLKYESIYQESFQIFGNGN